MTPKEISERLVAIHGALVEKLGKQPKMDPDLNVRQSGKAVIYLYSGDEYKIIESITGDHFEDILDAADKFVASMPDPDEAAKRTFQKNLGAVIDEGNSLAMPVEVMKPLSEASTALSENLLTYTPAE